MQYETKMKVMFSLNPTYCLRDTRFKLIKLLANWLQLLNEINVVMQEVVKGLGNICDDSTVMCDCFRQLVLFKATN